MLLTRGASIVFLAALAALVAAPSAVADHICEETQAPRKDGRGYEVIRRCEPHDEAASGGDRAGGESGGSNVSCAQVHWPRHDPWEHAEIAYTALWYRSFEPRGEGIWGDALFACSDGTTRSWWVCFSGDCSPGGGVEPDWTAVRDGLIQRAAARVDPPLPGLATSAASPRARAGPMAVVQAETWWWAEMWEPVVAQDVDGPLWVRVTATPTVLTVDPGDGSDPIVCPDGGTRYRFELDYYSQQGGSDCIHIYTQTSAGLPDDMVTITATLAWQVRWDAGGVAAAAGSGVLSTPTTVETLRLPVGEIQSVITSSS